MIWTYKHLHTPLSGWCVYNIWTAFHELNQLNQCEVGVVLLKLVGDGDTHTLVHGV